MIIGGSGAPILSATSGTNNIGVSSGGGAISSSPPLSGRMSPPMPTPPSSATSQREQREPTGSNAAATESVELQVDYWPLVRPGDVKDKSISKGGDQGKNSIKSTFRNLQVWRLAQNAQMGEISNGLTVSFATKEKKQKSKI